MNCAEDILRERIVRSVEAPSAPNCSGLSSALALCGGGLLAGIGLVKLLRAPNSWGALLAAGLGGALAYRGWRDWNQQQALAMLSDEEIASYVAVSPVDESSWESFPASDAPGRGQPTAW